MDHRPERTYSYCLQTLELHLSQKYSKMNQVKFVKDSL